MLSLEEVAQLTYNTLQSYMDQRGIDLAVGPLSDVDANSLARAYGELNWSGTSPKSVIVMIALAFVLSS
ncbi:hypothetical protein [Citrobacter braakii]|uniref:hypothetical protein n=1 Tax=Citrobacter braakii TaxID=57706 RepID=UPI00351CD2F5